MKKEIQFTFGIWNVSLTEEEVISLYKDHLFLQDAVLAVANPSLIDKSWDFAFSADEYKQKLKEFFKTTGDWNTDFIEECFETDKNITKQTK